jgi:membrane protein DedA with SNARE-associated domain
MLQYTESKGSESCSIKKIQNKEEHKMKNIETANKGLYVGTGIGLILFVLVGLLSGSLVGGLIGLKVAGFIFGAPLEGALLARVIVAVSMIAGVFTSALVFIGGTSFLGWAAGYVFDAMRKSSVKEAHTAKEH